MDILVKIRGGVDWTELVWSALLGFPYLPGSRRMVLSLVALPETDLKGSGWPVSTSRMDSRLVTLSPGWTTFAKMSRPSF